ncbi:alpha/beta hydrolase [Marinobacter sp. SS13-12]|uniref:alpha/beta hydrolase n=1 Tax=Marinobacter sp. SS13-12 TaxID=3050451 RepID=UPI00255545DD|nr:alpha/beta hydrolase [Marinobacter sp. SS13-12]MDK8465133.1 alpha/beta hydrolase [Marinobacter sp. SS13-12]
MMLSKNLLAMACATAVALTAPTVGFAMASDQGKARGQGIGKGLTEQVREHDSRVFKVQENADLAFTALTGATAYWGVYEGIQGPASYTAEFPQNWNGGVIMYTHGFRGQGQTVTREVPNLAFRNTALALGYAWAASSYSANYYDVRAAIEDTNRLALELTDYLERDWSVGYSDPGQYLIAGVSMGGHTAAAAVERETLETARYPVAYEGALPLCQAEQNQFQWLGDYPRVVRELGGFGHRPYEDFQQYVGEALFNLFEFDGGAPTFVPKNEAGQRLKDIAKNLTGGDRPIFDEGFQNPTWHGAVLGTGGRDGTVTGILANDIYDNTDRIYRWTDGQRFAGQERAFTAKVGRFHADKGVNPVRDDGVRWLPLVQGDFDVPVLTMHTLGDFFVPFVHQQLYREAAETHGSEDMLVQRAIRDPNHCGFSGTEFSTALVDLVTWVNSGIKPGGDEVLDPEEVADEQYGCAYTNDELSSGRDNLPQCE